jgi:hypothetical protein
MDEQREEPERPESTEPEADHDDDHDHERAREDDPRPIPGLTAPLDDFTEAEQHMQPVGVMPGAGPDVTADDESPPAPGTEAEADRARVDRSSIDDDVAEEGED